MAKRAAKTPTTEKPRRMHKEPDAPPIAGTTVPENGESNGQPVIDPIEAIIEFCYARGYALDRERWNKFTEAQQRQVTGWVDSASCGRKSTVPPCLRQFDTAAAARKAEKNATQKRMEGDGFPDPLPEEVQTAVAVYLTAKRESAEAAEAKGLAMQKLIDLGHKHNLDRIPIEGENKFIEIGVKDTCKVKTKPKDQEDARRNGEAD